MVGFDEYDFKARIAPGLLAALAIAFLVVSLGWKKYLVISIGGGLVTAAGGAYLLALLVRHWGRRIQADLWKSWGGPPTTQLLRTREQTDNSLQRDRWRSAVQDVTGDSLLPPPEEAKDPARADQTIELAVSQLLRFGQDPTYPLVKSENIAYGFERNVYGIRWIGRVVAFACLVVLIAARVAAMHQSHGALLIGIGIEAICLVTWIFLPSLSRTRAAADRYARELLKATVDESNKLRRSKTS